MATARLDIKVSFSGISSTKATMTAKLYYYGNGVSWSGNSKPYHIYLKNSSGTTIESGSGSKTFSTSTSAQYLGSISKQISRTHSDQKFKVTANFSTGVSIGTLTASESFTINAKPKYKVKYDANGGKNAPNDQTKWYGENLTLTKNKPERSGYRFLGWNTNKNASTASVQPGGTYTGNDDILYYAIWASANYTLTLNASGGSISASSSWTDSGSKVYKSIVSGNEYGTLPTAQQVTRAGYTFVGWYTSQYSGLAVTSSTKISGNTTIYAHWSSTLTLNSVKSDTETRTMNYADPITLPNKTYSGYSFLGWSSNSSGSGIIYAPGQVFKKAKEEKASTTLYGIWNTSYNKPKLADISVSRAIQRSSTAYEENDSGEFIKVNFSWSAGQKAGDISSTDISVYITYDTLQEVEIFTKSSTVASGNEEIFPVEYLSEAIQVPVGAQAFIKIVVTDTSVTEEGEGEDDPTYSITEEQTITVPLGGYLIHIPESEKSVVMFGVGSESDEGLIVNKNISTSGSIIADGDIVLKGSITVGNHPDPIGSFVSGKVTPNKALSSSSSYQTNLITTASSNYGVKGIKLSNGAWVIIGNVRFTNVTVSNSTTGCQLGTRLSYSINEGNSWTAITASRVVVNTNGTNNIILPVNRISVFSHNPTYVRVDALCYRGTATVNLIELRAIRIA